MLFHVWCPHLRINTWTYLHLWCPTLVWTAEHISMWIVCTLSWSSEHKFIWGVPTFVWTSEHIYICSDLSINIWTLVWPIFRRSLIINLAQLLSPSVALPAELVWNICVLCIYVFVELKLLGNFRPGMKQPSSVLRWEEWSGSRKFLSFGTKTTWRTSETKTEEVKTKWSIWFYLKIVRNVYST